MNVLTVLAQLASWSAFVRTPSDASDAHLCEKDLDSSTHASTHSASDCPLPTPSTVETSHLVVQTPLYICANCALLPVGLSLDLSEPGQGEAEGRLSSNYWWNGV